jgi:multiple sugar transport system permease protein
VVVCTAIVFVACLYFAVPIVWLVVAATKSGTQLFTTPGFAFGDIHLLSNLVDVSTYDGGIFWRWTLNSILYSVGGGIATTFVCALTGYALAMFRFRGRRIVTAIILGSMLVPSTVLAQPTYTLLVGLGLDNTYWGVLLPTMVYCFGVLLCMIFAQASVPMELIEAARLDGAGELRIFFTVGLRLMSTGLITVLLFAFLGSWNSYLLPLLVISDDSLMPLTVGLAGWNQAANALAGLRILTIVGSFVSVVPIAIVFAALQRFWRNGLTAGSIRG